MIRFRMMNNITRIFIAVVLVVLGLNVYRSKLPTKASRAAIELTCNICPARDQPSSTPSIIHQDSCPKFFEWIKRDLEPWQLSGINLSDLEQVQPRSTFRVVIKDGQLYVQKYYNCFQSRGVLTIWGLLMLLKRFPGQIPDVDLMFNCADVPEVPRSTERPGPLFGYSTNNKSYDIPMPDWSFWGWPEINISHWEHEFASIVEGSSRKSWIDKEKVAGWKGNPDVAKIRQELLKCNEPGLVEIHAQDWIAESQQGFAGSHLSDQCDRKYNIYVEGNSWSVSYKYIMACGNTVLDIEHQYEDFFTRSLKPWVHSVPVGRENLCGSLKDAISWANMHPEKAEEIGEAGQEFIKTELSMDHIYDYMFHLLHEYSILLNYDPQVPPGAALVCPASMRCVALPGHKEHLEKLVIPQPSKPCYM